jgi:hypothetical protein
VHAVLDAFKIESSMRKLKGVQDDLRLFCVPAAR